MLRGWRRLFATSVRLGLRQLARRRHIREALTRVVIPMDPTRYLELPWAFQAIMRSPGKDVLDLASPKLLAVELARAGRQVQSVDAFEAEIERWRAVAGGQPGLELRVADGRSLPFADQSFDSAVSISVLEHVGGDSGDIEALAELVRCTRPGATIVLTMPAATEAYDEYRSQPMYGAGDPTPDGYFFQRWYDPNRVDALIASEPRVRPVSRDVVRLAPDLDAVYTRWFPWLVPFGWLFGIVAREVPSDHGVVRLVLERVQ